MFENILIPKYLAELPIVLIAAVCTAGLSLLLELCFKKGMIFGGWLPWLAEQYMKCTAEVWRKWKYNREKVCLAINHDEDVQEYAMENFFWFKPLGACVYCMHVWLSIFTFWFWFGVFDIHWVWFFPFIPLSFFPLHLVKLLERIVKGLEGDED